MKKIIFPFCASFVLAALSVCSAETKRPGLAATKEEQAAATPARVFEWLKDGNERFASGKPQVRDALHDQQATASGQYPLAAILGCIDSRAPAEVVFDAGLGELFNARVAGNIANSDLIGSLEFACKVAGAKAVVIMGHTNCGAVKGACDKVQLGNLTGLLDQIQPAVKSVKDVSGDHSSKNMTFVEAVAEANVRLAEEHIRKTSSILSDLEKEGKIAIVGCIYDLKTGRVHFLDAPKP